MTTLWPWLAVAGVGALHGLNPATGWLFAVAIGVRSGDRSQALRALLPIAIGHALSVALVAAAVSLGASMDRELLIAFAVAPLVVAALARFIRKGRHRACGPSLPRCAGGEGGVSGSAGFAPPERRAPASARRLWSGSRTFAGSRKGRAHLPLALYSFAISTFHGSGLMLVPALIPLCSSNTPGRELTASGSLTMACAVVAVHTGAMLVVTGAVASGVCRGVAAGSGWLRGLRAMSSPHSGA